MHKGETVGIICILMNILSYKKFRVETIWNKIQYQNLISCRWTIENG